MGALFKAPGAGEAERHARQQREDLAKQKQKEQARLAEEEDEIARRKHRAGRRLVGRRSLITSQVGQPGDGGLLGGGG